MRFQGVFWSFLSFWGILVILRFRGYFSHVLGFGGIYILLSIFSHNHTLKKALAAKPPSQTDSPTLLAKTFSILPLSLSLLSKIIRTLSNSMTDHCPSLLFALHSSHISLIDLLSLSLTFAQNQTQICLKVLHSHTNFLSLSQTGGSLSHIDVSLLKIDASLSLLLKSISLI